MSTPNFRRVGAARPSHLMFTAGVGALIDLPNFSVMVKGLESWSHAGSGNYAIDEPRLRRAVNRHLNYWGRSEVTELRAAPWEPGADGAQGGREAQHIGVPVTPFPQWLRCTRCNILGGLDSSEFIFTNRNPNTPHEAKFEHRCGPHMKKPALAVAARFTLACTRGHLDEFPYREFVHHGAPCGKATKAKMRMFDHGGNQAANVSLECLACHHTRNIRDAMGDRGRGNLPSCRGRHPHLGDFAERGCTADPVLMVAGASNQWFPMTLSALALPPDGSEDVVKLVEERWADLEPINSLEFYAAFAATPHYSYLREFDAAAVFAAIEARRAAVSGAGAEEAAPPPHAGELLDPEWELLSAPGPRPATEDFALTEVPVPDALKGLIADVRQVDRLREARALIGFTRLDAPDPDAEEIAVPVRLSRGPLGWVPASEVRGEGIFVRVRDELLDAWVARMDTSDQMRAHREAFGRFRINRRSDRLSGDFDEMAGWPGARYIALHTLSHLLIRAIALECGYNSASLAERIYAGTPEAPHSGLLIYTAVPDSEGTLGGLVSQAEEGRLEILLRRALADAAHCSSDPLCGEHLPHAQEDRLHGAACHVCLFVSETTCERGNRFLDRRFLVPVIGSEDQVLTPPELLADTVF